MGANNFDNTRQMQVKRTRPTAALAMVSMDGWTVELLYQATHTDKKGHNITTYSNRLTLVVLIDVMNDYPLGYAIGEGESPDLIRQAIQNAIDHTRQLFGHWHILNQLQCDNYQKKALMPTYALVADKVTPARVGNAKAKPVEPYFSYLNTTYCQLLDNWSGFGVTSNPLRQPNAESLIEAFRREGLLYKDGVCTLEEFADLEVLKEKLTVPSKKDPNIRLEKKHSPKIIVIDSLNTLPVNSYKYVKKLTDLLPNKLFILIGWGKMDRGQVKPDGAIVKNAIFWADVKIKVEAFRAYANARGNSKTTVYTISEEMAKIYEAQL